jgi:hypothetical protein
MSSPISAPSTFHIPAAVSVFPDELYEAPRSWTARAYHKLIYYNKLDKGSTLRPGSSRIFTPEFRAAFKSLRYVILANLGPGKGNFLQVAAG